MNLGAHGLWILFPSWKPHTKSSHLPQITLPACELVIPATSSIGKWHIQQRCFWPPLPLITLQSLTSEFSCPYTILPSGESSSIERQSPKYISCRLMRLAQTPIQFWRILSSLLEPTLLSSVHTILTRRRPLAFGSLSSTSYPLSL